VSVPALLNAEDTVLLLIDFQERLFPAMHDREKLLRNLLKIAKDDKFKQISNIVK
jgi:hypothetical protein